ncbi:MAG: hypothetical protein LBR16_06780 [Treponema sp.]|jgi:hypothetical protein|nr:hypothetical protein [Treponema sp.]
MKNGKWQTIAETFGKIFVDLGKLTFGSFVLGIILKGEIEKSIILAIGWTSTAVLILLGVLLITVSKKEDS